LSKKSDLLRLIDDIENRPHEEQVAILRRLFRRKPTEKPPLEYLGVILEVSRFERREVLAQVRECLDTQGVRYDVKEYPRLLWTRIRFRIYMDDWRDLMVYLALEQSVRKFVEAAA
jgi:hypothetical protein